MTTVPAHRFPRRVSWIVITPALVAALTVAFGIYTRSTKGTLGAVAPPFVAGWLPKIDPLGAIVAAVACIAIVIGGRALVDARRVPPPAVAVLLFLMTLAAGLALNVARDGTTGWSEIFDLTGPATRHSVNEYLPGLPTLSDGVRNYLDRFAEVVPSQSVNVAGHPPGPLLLAHWFHATTAPRMAALVILIGSCCAPAAYRIGWTLSGDERIGRIAGVLCVASPEVLLFGVTSFDYAMAGCGALAACTLVATTRPWRIVGCLALAGAALMSWALLGVGAWAVLVTWRRDGFRRALLLGIGCGVAVLALQGFLAAAYGYDPIGTLRNTEQVYRDSLAQSRPYAFWLFGSPVAWGLLVGPPTVIAGLRGARAGTAAGVAILAVVALASVGGFTKAETERIWLFMAPLLCAAAAPYIARPRAGASAGDGPQGLPFDPRRLTVVLAALVVEAFVFQLLMNTVW